MVAVTDYVVSDIDHNVWQYIADAVWDGEMAT